MSAPEKPIWKEGEPFPLECAIWSWATMLMEHGKKGSHQKFLDDMKNLHGDEIVEKIKTLARKRWASERTGQR